jgi:hypothetical protein
MPFQELCLEQMVLLLLLHFTEENKLSGFRQAFRLAVLL